MFKKLRIAYFMHVDWNWAKQRPHFIFEGLSEVYDVDLYCVKSFGKSSLTSKNKRKDQLRKNYFSINKIPLSGKVRTLKWFERLSNSKLSKGMLDRYDIIWITSPVMLHFIPKHWLAGRKVIYDCMDDYLSFNRNQSKLKKHQSYEEELIKASKLVFASSGTLKDRMLKRYSTYFNNINIEVIQNGITEKWLDFNFEHFKRNSSSKSYNIVYSGTIGDWIDFDSLVYLLESETEISIQLIGPIDTKVVKHPRLNYIGPVSHEELPNYLSNADAFIMPFQLTDLVMTVDPVKMYEYISFVKPIFSIYYQETKKFAPFVKLYSTKEELHSYVKESLCQNDNKKDIETRREFLKNNTWAERLKCVITKIEEL